MQTPIPNFVPNLSRIPGLDGVRAIAILLVLIAHNFNAGQVGLSQLDRWYPVIALRSAGRFGVFLFFVLSGYLITRLLLHEKAITGSVSLLRFWFRRAFRIFPAYYTYLLTILILVKIGIFVVHENAFVAAAIYLWNYSFIFFPGDLGNDYHIIAHFWTLAVEEQFYLFFPFIFVTFKPKTTLLLLAAIIVLTPITTCITYLTFPKSRNFTPIMGHNIFGVSMAIGCAFAMLESLGIAEKLRCVLCRSYSFWSGLIFGLFIHPVLSYEFGGYFTVFGGDCVLGGASMAIIAHSIIAPQSEPLGRFLNSWIMVHIGIISYSLYVWHQLFLYLEIPYCSRAFSNLLMTVASLGVAAISYYGFEKPLMQLRTPIWNRWLSSQTPRSDDVVIPLESKQ